MQASGTPQGSATRRIRVLVYPDFQVLDATGPLEVFSTANRIHAHRQPDAAPLYEVGLVSAEPGPVRTSAGYALVADHGLRERAPIDTLLVAGGDGVSDASRDARLLHYVKRMAPRVERLGSVCSGTFLLAAAGLLAGRRVTSHWRACAALQKAYPQLEVDPDPIFVRDGSVYTSAGVTAGMDLALALLEADHGRTLALGVARQLVLFLKRPGGQSQFSAPLAAQSATRVPLQDLQVWVPEHLDADLSVEALSARVGMSPRNFSRVFTREVGLSPARFVEEVRVAAARRALEESDAGVESVAASCGFRSAEVMRRVFLRTVQVTPSAYRARFRGERVA